MASLIINTHPSPEKQSPNSTPKYLAIPRQGKQHSFEEVASLVLVSLFSGQTVRIVCLTQENLERWQFWLNFFLPNNSNLELFDANQATLRDCAEFLGSHPGDMVVLYGVCIELWANRISVGYVTALIEAVPTGIVMVV